MRILREGEVEVRGLFRLGSNATFLCQLNSDAGSLKAVYKPVRGERPLWDFPTGSLAKREAAAFEFACLLGWNFVPPTVFRANGPLGPGSFQEYMDLDLEQNYFLLREQDPDAMRRVAAFDILINNADRKAMHVARDTSGGIWLIDHGVCFHREWKLRTVIWDFAGEALPQEVLRILGNFTKSRPGVHHSPASDFRVRVQGALSRLLSAEEVTAVESRAGALRKTGRFPLPEPGFSVPWPIWA
ncbi:MAG: SCO1664 family protein [Anaerolineales bacterium]